MWKCLCECGNETVVSTSGLRSGNTQSCGCYQKEKAHEANFQNLSGKRFGRLTAKRGIRKNGNFYWKCQCDCGNYTDVLPQHLKRGLICSCGCLRSETSSKTHRKHGMKQTRLYKIWTEMKGRCYNKNVPAYKNYGGRGIIVCEEWLHDFEAFYNWSISNGYKDELSIDRINVNGNYEPSNCRWATYLEQANNTRANVIIEYNGKKQTIAEWAREIGINYATLQRRIKILKWDVEKAIETPVAKK